MLLIRLLLAKLSNSKQKLEFRLKRYLTTPDSSRRCYRHRHPHRRWWHWFPAQPVQHGCSAVHYHRCCSWPLSFPCAGRGRRRKRWEGGPSQGRPGRWSARRRSVEDEPGEGCYRGWAVEERSKLIYASRHCTLSWLGPPCTVGAFPSRRKTPAVSENSEYSLDC